MLQNFSKEYEVCSCLHITLGEIEYTIKEQGLTSLRQLQDTLRIGTGCRNCLFEEGDQSKVKKELYCKDILNDIKEKRI